jgi:hypothetical protein
VFTRNYNIRNKKRGNEEREEKVGGEIWKQNCIVSVMKIENEKREMSWNKNSAHTTDRSKEEEEVQVKPEKFSLLAPVFDFSLLFTLCSAIDCKRWLTSYHSQSPSSCMMR